MVPNQSLAFRVFELLGTMPQEKVCLKTFRQEAKQQPYLQRKTLLRSLISNWGTSS